MDSSEEQESTVFESKILRAKNLSESDINSKSLSVIPDDDIENTDLHIVGFKVKLDSDQVYSFDVEKARSKSVDILTAVENSKRIFNRHVAQAHVNGSNEIRNIFRVPHADEQTLPETKIKNVKRARSRKSPALELKLGSLCADREEFELHINSKNDGTDFASDESLCSGFDCYDAAVQHMSFEKPYRYREVSQQKTPGVPLTYLTELASRKIQTERETESSSVQTTDVEVLDPWRTLDAGAQTNRRCDVSTSTEYKKAESAETETEDIPKNQRSCQTETEIVIGSSQTESAAVFSIDRVYDASTQTDKLTNVATSTDFNIYIVDREKTSEKVTDTEDLPYAPLMVAIKEKVEVDDEVNDVKYCQYSCGHQKQNEWISCCHKECGANMSLNLTQNDNEQFNPSRASNGDHDFCCPKKDRDLTNKCDAKLRSDVHPLYCCKYRNLSTCTSSKPNEKVVEKLKPSDCLQLTDKEYSSFTLHERISGHSKVEIVKNLESELNKMKTIVAVRVQCVPKVERAEVLKIPVFFQHFLNSFSLSVYCQPKVVINPVQISLAVSQPPDSESDADRKLKFHTELSLHKELEDKRQEQPLMIYDGKKERSVIVSCLPTIMASDDKHSQVCLCNSCYTNVQSVLEDKRRNILQKDSETHPTKYEGKLSVMTKDQIKSTSPKIQPKNFDYTGTDTWTPYKHAKDGVFSREVEATDIIHVGDSDSDQSTESTNDIDLNSACETVNDHVLGLRLVDKDTIRKAAKTLHKAWFETAASKHSDTSEVRYYMQYFAEFSNNLLRTLLHSVDDNGNNVVHFALANNRFDLVEEFLSNEFAVELLKKTNKTGNTPLMICAISQPKTESHWSTIRKCLELGDINAKSKKSGQTPLMNAASCGFQAMVDLLLDVGAKPNMQDKDESTALMYAAEHGHENCTKSLVRHKDCDPTIKDKDGQTACSIALNNNHKNIAVLIHMQTLDKRRLSKNSYTSKKYIRASRTKALTVKP